MAEQRPSNQKLQFSNGYAEIRGNDLFIAVEGYCKAMPLRTWMDVGWCFYEQSPLTECVTECAKCRTVLAFPGDVCGLCNPGELPELRTSNERVEPLVTALIQAVKMERDEFHERCNNSYSTDALILAKERVALCKAAVLDAMRAAVPPSDALSDREKWLVKEGFIAGFCKAGGVPLRNQRVSDLGGEWLDECVADAVTVEMALAHEANKGTAVTKEPRRLSASEERSFTETALRSPRRVSDETSASQVTTWKPNASGFCEHCGLSWMLHIAEDDQGRKDVCSKEMRLRTAGSE